MTFDDDFVQLESIPGRLKPLRIAVKTLGLEWPPPVELLVTGFTGTFLRVSYSQISDEDRQAMTAVCRGALYMPKNPA